MPSGYVGCKMRSTRRSDWSCWVSVSSSCSTPFRAAWRRSASPSVTGTCGSSPAATACRCPVPSSRPSNRLPSPRRNRRPPDLALVGDDGSLPPRVLVSCRGTDVSYGQLQVLFGVDFQVREGEMVALLGTNGAGKSTLLKAMCGLVASKGSVQFAGVELRGKTPEQIVREGVALMPGGKSIFPTLDVAEHLRLATWTFRRDHARIEADTQRVLELFPALQRRLHTMAGDMSGGEQQQLALGADAAVAPKGAVDRRALPRPRSDGRRAAPRRRPRAQPLRHHDRGGGAVGERRAEPGGARRVHGEGSGSVRGGDARAARPSRHLAQRLPPGGRRARNRRRHGVDRRVANGNGSNGHGSNGHGSNGHGSNETGSGAGDTAMPTVDLSHLASLREMETGSPDRQELPVLECRGVAKRFGGVIAVDHVDLVVRPRRDRGARRPERRRQDDAARLHQRIPPHRRRADHLPWPRHHRLVAVRAGPWPAGPLVPGGPPVPVVDGGRDDRRGLRAHAASKALDRRRVPSAGVI